MEVKGFVIQNAEGDYLSAELFWVEKESGVDAYVHPEKNIGNILSSAASWTVRPTKMRAALYRGKGTVVYGVPVKLSW